MTSAPTRPRPRVSFALSPNRLGPVALVFFVLGAAAPLASTAGGTTAGWAITGIAGIPIAFVVTAVLLLVFIAGYAAMSRYVTNAGAIYTYVARGLGRMLGVGSAGVAVLSYSAMQIGLYGGIGAVAATFAATRVGPHSAIGHLPWWVFSAIAWLVIAVCGRLRVDVNSRVLGVLMSAECLLMLVFDAIMIGHPHGGHVTVGTLSPAALASPAISVAVVIAFTSMVGVEDTTNYSEESRPGSIGKAMRISVLAGAVLYALSAWAMSVATGPDNVVAAARGHGSELMFDLVAGTVGAWAVDAGHLLFLTSLFASCLSFHNTTSRYLFSLGREGVVPRFLGITDVRTGAPKNASATQSTIAAVVLVVAAIGHWDPMANMFFWMGTLAGLGVIVLMALASAAVIGFFARHPQHEPASRTVLWPVIAVISLGAVAVITLAHYATLLGVPPGAAVAWWLPGLLLVAFVAGLARAGWLYLARRDTYTRIGFGADAAERRATPLTAPTPPDSNGARA